MKPGTIVDEAAFLVSGPRAVAYGPARANHENIARLWNAFLSIRPTCGGKEQQLTAHDVALMMVLLKVARTQLGEGSRDTYRDMAGYAAIAGAMFSGEDGGLCVPAA